MDTLIVFLIIFVPASLILWWMLRHTRDTIGSNSPLKVKRTYKITAWYYFLTSSNLPGYFMLPIGSMLLKLIFTIYIGPDVSYQILVWLLLLVTSLACIGLGLFVIVMDLNHWNNVQGVTIETFPEEHELEITFSDSSLRLKNGDIERIVVVHNNAKARFAFTRYYLTNGDYFVLSDKMPGDWVIHEYFKKIPATFCVTAFPLIS
ncbi:hypothetical protein [Dyadobacter sandarakinus]|uniref:PH domain-containing protein n=1 Tax=Dyadobacter sandarakinus TaxID=2747268 RepID=A0ABX7IA88_9BACT|nr:hypothetical protein [Dyadobacter sandarakinus]QRR03032.1 hypothetical protein HWI92_20025 [Dyadobacter sandarakinus]